MYRIRYQSKVNIPGMLCHPYLYYPSSSSPTVFTSREEAQRTIEGLPQTTTYEIVSILENSRITHK